MSTRLGTMHGVTARLTRPVLPRWVNSQPSLTPAVCGEEAPFDRAVRAVTHTLGHNSVTTFDAPRGSVLENRGSAQPEYPLRRILVLYIGEDINMPAVSVIVIGAVARNGFYFDPGLSSALGRGRSVVWCVGCCRAHGDPPVFMSIWRLLSMGALAYRPPAPHFSRVLFSNPS